MPITTTDLLSPTGELEASWFPTDSPTTLTARLQAYINDGVAVATAAGVVAAELDAATIAWAYHRAYRAIFLQLSQAPSSVTLNDQGSKSRTDQQRDAFKAEADRYLATYEGYLPIATRTLQRVPSGGVPTRHSW